jgi:hypothetical protein
MHPATLSPDSESHFFNGREIFQKERVKLRPLKRIGDDSSEWKQENSFNLR